MMSQVMMSQVLKPTKANRRTGKPYVGKCFISLKLDVLESLFLRLNGQNRFRALFTRIILVSIF